MKTRVVGLAVVAVWLSLAGCGQEKPPGGSPMLGGSGGSNSPGGSGGISGAGGRIGSTGGTSSGGVAGVGGAGGGAGGAGGTVAAACPLLTKTGDPCATTGTSCQLRRCDECIGGFFKLVRTSGVPCLCAGGTWTCPPVVSPGTISDCVTETPLTCASASELYTDATCSQHPSCTPLTGELCNQPYRRIGFQIRATNVYRYAFPDR